MKNIAYHHVIHIIKEYYIKMRMKKYVMIIVQLKIVIKNFYMKINAFLNVLTVINLMKIMFVY